MTTRRRLQENPTVLTFHYKFVQQGRVWMANFSPSYVCLRGAVALFLKAKVNTNRKTKTNKTDNIKTK